jgi:hypothetical protein
LDVVVLSNLDVSWVGNHSQVSGAAGREGTSNFEESEICQTISHSFSNCSAPVASSVNTVSSVMEVSSVMTVSSVMKVSSVVSSSLANGVTVRPTPYACDLDIFSNLCSLEGGDLDVVEAS